MSVWITGRSIDRRIPKEKCMERQWRDLSCHSIGWSTVRKYQIHPQKTVTLFWPKWKEKKEKFLSIWSLLPIQVSFQPNIIWFSKAKYSKVLGHMRVKWQNVAFIDAKTWHQMSSRNIKVQCKFNESTNQLGKHAFVLIQLDFLFWMFEYGVGRYAIWADRFG